MNAEKQPLPGWENNVFVMTDIVASTQRWEADTERMAADLAIHDHLTIREFEAQGGRKVHTTGDGFLFVFESVIPALVSALRVQRELPGAAWSGAPLQIRIGIAKGRAQYRDGDYYGPTLNRCARVMAAGAGDQILLSEEICDHTIVDDSRFALHDHGPSALKDIGELLRIWELLIDDDTEPRPPSTLAQPNHNLPSQVTRFIGREADLEQLDKLIQRRPLTTLTGLGGVGKTRLALKLATMQLDRFGDGVWFVGLDTITDGARVAALTSLAVGIQPIEGLDPVDRLVAGLGAKQALLILDCCEHVVPACRELISRVIADCSDVSVLLTSRTPIGVTGEFVWSVDNLKGPDRDGSRADGLGETDAELLFLDRAEAHAPSVDLSAPTQQKAIAQIVSRLEGLPLAIELAAARIGALDAVELLRRLDDQPAHAQSTDLPARHRTIEATIEWSDQLLQPAAQTLLRRLTVFNDAPDLEAVESVCGEDLGESAVNALEELIDASLLTTATGADGRSRFRMLDSVASYAASRWDLDDQLPVRDLHAAWILDRAKQLGPLVQVDDGALRQLGHIQSDIEVGLAWLFGQRRGIDAATVAGYLAVFWVVTGRAAYGRALLEQALAVDLTDHPTQEAATLEGAGIAAGLDADYERSDELLTASAAMYRDLGRLRKAAYPDFWRARNRVVQAFYGRSNEDGLRTASRLLSHCLTVFRENGDLFGMVLALPYQAWGEMLARSPGAKEPLEEALLLVDQPGLERVAAYARAHLAHIVLVMDDDPVEAGQLLHESIELLRGVGDRQNLLICQLLASAIAIRLNQLDDADHALRDAAEIASRGGSREWELAVAAMGLALAATRRDLVLSCELHGLVSEQLPSWRTMLANAGLEAHLEDIDGVIDAVPTNIMRAATRAGTKRTTLETLERLSTTGGGPNG